VLEHVTSAVACLKTHLQNDPSHVQCRLNPAQLSCRINIFIDSSIVVYISARFGRVSTFTTVYVCLFVGRITAKAMGGLI